MKVIIAGGGIGGLVTALSLHQKGITVKVFESVELVKPLGVGINLLPHAVRVLTNLGLLDKIEHISVETEELIYANKYGQHFWIEPRGRFAGYKWPQLSIHRGKFQMLLWEEAIRILGSENLQTQCHLQSCEQNDKKVTAKFIRKSTGEIAAIEECDILIGADGINSEIRKILYPKEGGVIYSGNILYRGAALMKPFLSGASMAMIGSLKQKMVVYPISKELDEHGNQLINWVANIKSADGPSLTIRDWNRKVDKELLLEKYESWQYDWLNIPEMINKTDSGIFEFPMSDRDPLHRWSFGRITLLGDAAHPMYPIGSNGASQAILDADCIAETLSNEKDPIHALEMYDTIRVPAAAMVVKQNRQKGPDIILDLMEERFPNGFSNDEIPQNELAKLMQHYKEVAGFDIETLNSKS